MEQRGRCSEMRTKRQREEAQTQKLQTSSLLFPPQNFDHARPPLDSTNSALNFGFISEYETSG